MAAFPPEPLMRGMKKGQRLEEFMATWGSLDHDFELTCNEMVERIIRFIRQNVSLSVAKVLKGGSIGRNTQFTNISDVDLYIFVNDLRSVDDMKTKTRQIVDRIRSKMDSAEWMQGRVQFEAYTDWSIKFTITCSDLHVGHQQLVEIFPAYDLLQHKSVEEVYQEMTNVPEVDRRFYNVCFAQIKTDFIRQAPAKLHSFIKLMKCWLKEEVNVEMKAARSYFIEVVVMYRWQRANKPHDFDISDWFEEIMSQLADFPSLCICWENRYNATDYRPLPSRPFVLDSANPFNDLTPLPRHQHIIRRHAKTALKRLHDLKVYRQQGPPPIISGMERGESLQHFIEHTLLPRSDIRDSYSRLVERVTYFLQHHSGFSVSEVIKGGSVGKSTNVLGKADVDLVVFINSVKSVQDLENKMPHLLETLKIILESQWTDFAGHLKLERQTGHALQYKLSVGNTWYDVDILPAFDILKGKSKEAVWREMNLKPADEREFYSVCFSPLQKEFVKEIPNKLKNLIRVVKYWAKEEVNVEKKVICSYCLELIVIYQSNFWSVGDFNTNEKFEEIMQLLTGLNTLRVLWSHLYRVSDYYDVSGTSGAVVLDPANPFMNVAPKEKHQARVMTCANNVLYKLRALRNYRTGKYIESS